MTVSPVAGGDDALARVQRENETLYAVIKTVSSSLDLDRVLDGIVEIATDATGCHACFIYFVDGERLVLRAASPRYSHLVGQLSWGMDEGLTGWVARTKTPEFIRDHALDDPRMNFAISTRHALQSTLMVKSVSSWSARPALSINCISAS